MTHGTSPRVTTRIWKPALLVAIRRAQAINVSVEDIAAAADITEDEVRAAIRAMRGRNPDQAAAWLNDQAAEAGTGPAPAAEPQAPRPSPQSAPRPGRATDYAQLGAGIAGGQPPLSLDQDDELVRACRKAGGFPRLQPAEPPVRRVSPPPFSVSVRREVEARRKPQPVRPAPLPAKSVRPLRLPTARILGWAWWFAASGWLLEEIEDLFDLIPGELVKRLPEMPAGAAA